MLTLLLTMISFSLAMSLSPGPVNMIILSSGVNYGVKRTIPYVSGATIGFTLLLLFIGLGFSQLLNAFPEFLTMFGMVGSLYIIYMGYKIATSKPTIDFKNEKIPQFNEGFLLQWINPKAWIACVSGATLFSSAESHQPFLMFAAIYFLVCYLSLGLWAVAGDKVSVLLKSNLRMRIFNGAMGLLLVFTGLYLGFFG